MGHNMPYKEDVAGQAAGNLHQYLVRKSGWSENDRAVILAGHLREFTP